MRHVHTHTNTLSLFEQTLSLWLVSLDFFFQRTNRQEGTHTYCDVRHLIITPELGAPRLTTSSTGQPARSGRGWTDLTLLDKNVCAVTFSFSTDRTQHRKTTTEIKQQQSHYWINPIRKDCPLSFHHRNFWKHISEPCCWTVWYLLSLHMHCKSFLFPIMLIFHLLSTNPAITCK